MVDGQGCGQAEVHVWLSQGGREGRAKRRQELPGRGDAVAEANHRGHRAVAAANMQLQHQETPRHYNQGAELTPNPKMPLAAYLSGPYD